MDSKIRVYQVLLGVSAIVLFIGMRFTDYFFDGWILIYFLGIPLIYIGFIIVTKRKRK